MPANGDDWESKAEGKGNKWKQNTQGSRDEYEQGVAEYLGVSEAEIATGSTWEQQVDRVSADEFNRSVQGKGQKWADNYTRGMTQG